ncbi:MAG: hypothetical protein EXX96DRAFT_464108, partial [Benjaminiella poitrasii]
KNDVMEEIKETVPEVAPAVVANDEPLKPDLKAAVQHAVDSVVGSRAVDIYAYLESKTPVIKEDEKAPAAAVEDVKSQTQSLASTIKSAVTSAPKEDEKTANLEDVKTEAAKLSDSVKVAAVAVGGAAVAGIASVVSAAKDFEEKVEGHTNTLSENVKSAVAGTVNLAQDKIAQIQKDLPVVQEEVKKTVNNYVEDVKAMPATQKMMDTVGNIQGKLS